MDEERKSRSRYYWLAVPTLLTFYILSAGPYLWFIRKGWRPGGQFVANIYAPLDWAWERAPQAVDKAFRMYLDLFGGID